MRKFIVLSLFLLFLSACSTIQPHLTQYKLEVNLETKKVASTPNSICKQKSIKIVNAFSANNLVIEDMYYMIGQYEMDRFTESGWVASPSKSITLQTIKAVENSKIFKHTSGMKSRVRTDFILENSIENFMQYFSDDLQKSHIKVIIKSTLVDAKTKKSIASKKFLKIKDTQSLDAKGGVVALNSALFEILNDEVNWLSEVCK